jgi:hypothetical protein
MPKKACDASAGVPQLLPVFSTALVHKPDTQRKDQQCSLALAKDYIPIVVELLQHQCA